MATITTSIGDGTSHDQNVDITGTSGAGPSYTVTLAAAGTDVVNGDALWDEHATPRKYLITAGAGTTSLTVFDSTGVSAAPDSSGTSTAQIKRYYNGATPLTDWEADLDNAASSNLYANGDVALGECYNDAAFDENAVININGGGGITLTSRTLSVAEGERHNGTAGTGARMAYTAATGNQMIDVNVAATTVEWLEVTNSAANGVGSHVVDGGGTANVTFRNLIVHDIDSQFTYNRAAIYNTGNVTTFNVLNCIVYNYESDNDANETFAGIRTTEWGGRSVNILNNTVWNVNGTAGSSLDIRGISVDTNEASKVVKNNISVGNVAPDTVLDFYFPGTTVDGDWNLSSDTSADDALASPPGNCLLSKTAANQFVSTDSGFEDLRLKSGADAIDAGTDLGTTPTGVNISIQGFDRDSAGVVWDIGADEYVAAGAGYNTIFNLSPGTADNDIWEVAP